MASGPIPPNPSARPKLGLLERALPYSVISLAGWPSPRASSLNFFNLELEEQMRRHRERRSRAAAAEWTDDGAGA